MFTTTTSHYDVAMADVTPDVEASFPSTKRTCPSTPLAPSRMATPVAKPDVCMSTDSSTTTTTTTTTATATPKVYANSTTASPSDLALANDLDLFCDEELDEILAVLECSIAPHTAPTPEPTTYNVTIKEWESWSPATTATAVAAAVARLAGSTDSVSKPFFATDTAVTFREYVATVFKYAALPNSVAVVALIYLNKLPALGLPVTQFNAGRLFGATYLLAHKWLQDNCYTNKDWSSLLRHASRTTYYSLSTVNSWERRVLTALNYNISASPRAVHDFVFVLDRC